MKKKQKNIKAFILSTKNDKLNYFTKLLEENNFENDKKLNYGIISFDKYINILKLFIHLYYYEKDLLENPENIFKEDHDYYLIKPYWINNFKEYYCYSNYVNNFNSLKTDNNSNINYSNINNFINSIIEIENDINFGNQELFEKIINIKKNDIL